MVQKRPVPESVGPRAAVWSYPWPPALDSSTEHVVVSFGGETVADSHHVIRVLETSHTPAYYLPPEDVCTDLLEPTGTGGVAISRAPSP